VEILVALSLPREVASVPVSRQVLDSCLETLGVAPDTRNDIALALSEACANVVLHAGPGDDYTVTAATRAGRCIIEVVDNGYRSGAGSMPRPGSVPRPHGHVSTLAENGRGLQIIDAVSDDLTLSGDARGGTTVHFEKKLDWLPDAAARHLLAAD
jgi:serine/threonine-protein kinase RsbW